MVAVMCSYVPGAGLNWGSEILKKLDVGVLKGGDVIALQRAVGPPVKRSDGRTGAWNRMLVVTEGSEIWQVDYVDVTDDPTVWSVKRIGVEIDAGTKDLVSTYIPWSEVPFRAEWFTASSMDYLLVLTWSVTRNVRAPGPVFFIYCFVRSGNCLKKVIDADGDLILKEVAFCDMDGDGVPDLEISGQGESFVSGWMYVWRMRGENRADPIVVHTAEGFNPSLVLSKDGSQCSILTRSDVIENRKQKLFRYRWNSTSDSFVLESTRVEILTPNPDR